MKYYDSRIIFDNCNDAITIISNRVVYIWYDDPSSIERTDLEIGGTHQYM